MVSKISMRASMAEMNVGEVLNIPLGVRGYNSVRNCASLLGLSLGRKYSVSINRADGLSSVTRTA